MSDIQHEPVRQDSKPVPKKDQPTPKLMEVFHDETPSMITDHKFSPRGEWFTLCRHCGLAESAHAETELHYYGDDMLDD